VDALVLRQLAGLALEKSRFKDDVSLDQVLEATGGEPGPERILDVLLCLGPYGDGCGVEPEGLTLARVQQHEHGMDLGPLEPMLPGHVATESGKIELAPERLVADLPRLDAWLAEEPGPGLRLINRRDVRSMNSWLPPVASSTWSRLTSSLKRLFSRARPASWRSTSASTCAGSGVALSVATGRPGANVNAVTDDVPSDAPSGASMLFGGPVEVEALSEAS
jgi:hypothetical protein